MRLIKCIHILFFVAASAFAQTIGPDSAVALALNNNPLAKLAMLKIEQEKALLPSTINIGNLDVVFQSPTGTDQRPGLLQSFAFPTVYNNQYKLQKQSIELAKTDESITQNYLKYQVKNSYLSLQYAIAKEKIYVSYDSILQNLIKVNDLKYKTGAIANLEKINGEAKYKVVQNQLRIAQAESKAAFTSFNRLLTTESNFKPNSDLSKLQETVSSSNDILANPLLKLYEQKKTFASKNLKLEKSKQLPNIVLGYLSQTSPDPAYFYRLQFGLSLPIWYWRYKSNIDFAKKGVEVSTTQSLVQKNTLEREFIQASTLFNQAKESLSYYELTGLNQAKELEYNATESLRIGSISYYIYLLNIDQAFQIRLAYLETLKTFNQSLIYLAYLKGEI